MARTRARFALLPDVAASWANDASTSASVCPLDGRPGKTSS